MTENTNPGAPAPAYTCAFPPVVLRDGTPVTFDGKLWMVAVDRDRAYLAVSEVDVMRLLIVAEGPTVSQSPEALPNFDVSIVVSGFNPRRFGSDFLCGRAVSPDDLFGSIEAAVAEGIRRLGVAREAKETTHD